MGAVIINVFSSIVIKLGRLRDDLSWQAGHRLIVTENADFDLARLDAFLDHNFTVIFCGKRDCLIESLGACRFRNSDRGAEVGRLDKAGKAYIFDHTGFNLLRIRFPLRPQEMCEIYNRQAGFAEKPLHDNLIHSCRGSEHTAADVWNIGHLEQALNSPVFTVRTVQYRYYTINLIATICLTVAGESCQPRFSWIADNSDVLSCTFHDSAWQKVRRFTRGKPFAFLGDCYRHDLVFTAIECIDNRFGRAKRDFMFTRATTEDNSDSEFL